MLVNGPLHWMLPAALVVAALAPLAAAAPLDHVSVHSVPTVVVSDDLGLGETLQGLQDSQLSARGQQTADRVSDKAPDPQTQPADDPPAQPPTLGEGIHAVGQARDTANDQIGVAQDTALAQVDVVRGDAEGTLGALPQDPVGFAQAAADGAAQQAGQQIPNVLGDSSMQPQAGETAVVGQDHLVPPILAGSILVATAAGATFFAFWLAGSSGTVGAGAVAKSGDLRRLLPFASPLFTRFEKETVLGHPRREALYAHILQQPGISLQALGEATGLSRTAVLHHLRLLELQHLVVSKRMGRSRHYYENGGRYGRDAKEAYAILQNQRSKEVAEYIRLHPGTMQKELCEALSIQPSIAHWHVRRLQAAQLVDARRQGRAVNYFPGTGLLEVAAQVPIPEAGLTPVVASMSLA